MYLFADAALLGLASGPACLASCGPVLVPTLAARGNGVAGTTRVLAGFLSGRLAGYLAFSVLAWSAGLAAPANPCSRSLVYGLIDLGLSGVLVSYAFGTRRCGAACAAQAVSTRLVQIEVRARSWSPMVLGLLTGLSVCPPFLAAGARAAETHSLSASALFFFVFFLGTAVWSLPLVAAGWLRRLPKLAEVARIMLCVVAAWYAYLGVIALLWRFSHAC